MRRVGFRTEGLFECLGAAVSNLPQARDSKAAEMYSPTAWGPKPEIQGLQGCAPRSPEAVGGGPSGLFPFRAL